jgi:Tfp pilus assembly protein PilF
MNIVRKARESQMQRHQQRIFLCYHPNDNVKRDELIRDLISYDAGANCVVSWIEKPWEDIDETDIKNELHETNLFVFLVTRSFFDRDKGVDLPEFRIAKELVNLPKLPVVVDAALFSELTVQEQAVHGIAMNDHEYRMKLKAQLDNFIASDDLIKQIIENAFSGQVFLSYRKKDIDHARAFMKAFHDIPDFESIAVWYDNFLIAGRAFKEEIFDSIDKSDVFVLLVTPNLFEKNDAGETNFVLSEELPYAVRTKKKIVAVEAVKTDASALRKAGIATEEIIQIIHFTEYIKLREADRQNFFFEIGSKFSTPNISGNESYEEQLDKALHWSNSISDLQAKWENSFSERTSKHIQKIQKNFLFPKRRLYDANESKAMLCVAYNFGIYVEQDITRAGKMMNNPDIKKLFDKDKKLYNWMIERHNVRAMTGIADQKIAECNRLIEKSLFEPAQAIALHAFQIYNDNLTDKHPKTQSAKELVSQIKIQLAMSYKDRKSLDAHVAYYAQQQDLQRELYWLDHLIAYNKAVYGEYDLETAYNYHELGCIFFRLGRNDEAVKWFLLSRKCLKAHGEKDRDKLLMLQLNLGKLYIVLQQKAVARKELQIALKLAKRGWKDWSIQSEVYQELVQIECGDHRWFKAFKYARKDRKYVKEYGNALEYAQSCSRLASVYLLGGIYIDENRLPKALMQRCYQEAIVYYEEAFNGVVESPENQTFLMKTAQMIHMLITSKGVRPRQLSTISKCNALISTK